jgi:uncharacterized membrane protein YdjX (TVP38/TMEM64 family)
MFYLSSLIFLSCVVLYFIDQSFKEFANHFWEVIWSEDEHRITEMFRGYGIAGPLLIIAFMILQMFLIVFPTWLPMIVAVLGYGGIWGFVISIVANFLSATIGYFIGYEFSESSRKGLIGKKTYEKMSRFTKVYGFWAVVLFRISPFLTNDGMSILAGLMDMGYKKYIKASMLGIVPLAAAIAYFGKDFETLENGLYWIGGAGVVIYIIYLYMNHKSKKIAKGHE